MVPAEKGDFAKFEASGVEDPRITFIDDEYLITYSAYSRHGVRIGLAKTKDWKTLNRFALITEADYRNVIIFPEKFNGLYARFTCGAVPEDDGTLKIYWGAANSAIGVGTANISELVDLCLTNSRKAM